MAEITEKIELPEMTEGRDLNNAFSVIAPRDAIKTIEGVRSSIKNITIKASAEVAKAIEDGVSKGVVLNATSLEYMSNQLGRDSEALVRFAEGYTAEKVSLASLINDDTVRDRNVYATEVGISPAECKVLTQTLYDEGSITKNELNWILSRRIPVVGHIPEVEAHTSAKVAALVLDKSFRVGDGSPQLVRAEKIDATNVVEEYGISWEEYVAFDTYANEFSPRAVDTGDPEPEFPPRPSMVNENYSLFSLTTESRPVGPPMAEEGSEQPAREGIEHFPTRDLSGGFKGGLPLRSDVDAILAELKDPARSGRRLKVVEKFVGQAIDPDTPSEEISRLIRARTEQIVAERQVKVTRGGGPTREQTFGKPSLEELRAAMARANDSRKAYIASKTNAPKPPPDISTDLDPNDTPPENPSFDLHGLLDGTVAALTEFLATGEGDSWLAELHRVEFTKKNRASAFAAIEARNDIANTGQDLPPRDYSGDQP